MSLLVTVVTRNLYTKVEHSVSFHSWVKDGHWRD